MKGFFTKLFILTLAVSYLTVSSSTVLAFNFYQNLQWPFYDPTSGSACTVNVDFNLSGNSNVEKAYGFFIAAGLSPVQSAGVVGNLVQESHVDPTIQQDGSSDPLPKPNVGFGIAQWTSSGRQQRLVEFARQNSLPVTDLGLQLNFLWHELTQSYSGTYSELKASASIAQATTIFMKGYERPGDPQIEKRISYAEEIYGTYAGVSSGQAVVVPSTSNCDGITGPGQDTKYIDGFIVYSQYDPSWANDPYASSTVGASGCGPAAMAMIITNLTGRQVTPDVVAKYAGDKGQYIPGEGSSWSLPTVVAPQWGLNAKFIGANIAKITAALQAGGLVIASGQGPLPYTSGGHYIVIRGVTADGKWQIGDSGHSDTSDKEWDPKQLLASMNDGSVYAITK